jgi:hypothetical protein
MEGRDILRVFDVEVFEATPEKWHQPDEYPKTMYQDAAKQYQEQYSKNYKWGMTIDLNSCVGATHA